MTFSTPPNSNRPQTEHAVGSASLFFLSNVSSVNAVSKEYKIYLNFGNGALAGHSLH